MDDNKGKLNRKEIKRKGINRHGDIRRWKEEFVYDKKKTRKRKGNVEKKVIQIGRYYESRRD